MDRLSTKHGPRVDDQLKHELGALTQGAPAESRVEEEREQEAPSDGEPTATTRPERDEFLGLGADAATARREISRHLGLHAFPGQRDALVEHARGEGAGDAVLDALRGLPADREFATVYDVTETLGLHAEERAPAGRTAPPDADDPVA
jgi:hypothetical protein